MVNEVNEGTTPTIRVSFFDKDGQPVAPAAGTYRIDDERSRRAIKAVTALPTLSYTVDIILGATDTRILNRANSYERRILTVQYDYGSGEHGNDQYTFSVKNLANVTS
jgi:hypothetical protein